MNEEELRIKIYERLGLTFGSLTSESGNDWVRAEKEVLEDFRQKVFEKLNAIKTTDYLNIHKNSDEFISVLNSNFIETQNFKIILAQRTDLTSLEIDKLLQSRNKDILINLAKYQNLNSTQINFIIENGVYLAKKNLIENQNLSKEEKEKLFSIIKTKPIYKDLLSNLLN